MGNYSLTFEGAVEKLNSWLRYESERFGRFSRLNEPEDFFSIGQQVIWRTLPNFKITCPECDSQFLSLQEYGKHLHNGKILIPKFNLIVYLKMRILAEFQSEIKKETAQKRKPLNKVISSLTEFEVALNKSVSEDFELQDTISFLMKNFSDTEKEIIDFLTKSCSVSETIIEYERQGVPSIQVRKVLRKFRLCINNFFQKFVA